MLALSFPPRALLTTMSFEVAEDALLHALQVGWEVSRGHAVRGATQPTEQVRRQHPVLQPARLHLRAHSYLCPRRPIAVHRRHRRDGGAVGHQRLIQRRQVGDDRALVHECGEIYQGKAAIVGRRNNVTGDTYVSNRAFC